MTILNLGRYAEMITNMERLKGDMNVLARGWIGRCRNMSIYEYADN